MSISISSIFMADTFIGGIIKMEYGVIAKFSYNFIYKFIHL